MSRPYPGVTRLKIMKSLRLCDDIKMWRVCEKCCKHFIHFSHRKHDVFGWPVCMAAPCEPEITWNAETHTCDYWHDGTKAHKLMELYEY